MSKLPDKVYYVEHVVDNKNYYLRYSTLSEAEYFLKKIPHSTLYVGSVTWRAAAGTYDPALDTDPLF